MSRSSHFSDRALEWGDPEPLTPLVRCWQRVYVTHRENRRHRRRLLALMQLDRIFAAMENPEKDNSGIDYLSQIDAIRADLEERKLI